MLPNTISAAFTFLTLSVNVFDNRSFLSLGLQIKFHSLRMKVKKKDEHLGSFVALRLPSELRSLIKRQ